MTDAPESEWHAEEAAQEIEARRVSARFLANAVRHLCNAVTVTEADAADRHRLAEDVEELVRRVGRLPGRRAGALATIDDAAAPLTLYNASKGVANALSPELVYLDDDYGPSGSVTLRAQHEGPRGHAHGGWIAMIFDDVLGHVAEQLDPRVMTGQLAIRYLRPVPLEQQLVIRAHLVGRTDRRFTITGAMSCLDRPHDVLAEADGVFVAPKVSPTC